jgi:hypothetical protein
MAKRLSDMLDFVDSIVISDWYLNEFMPKEQRLKIRLGSLIVPSLAVIMLLAAGLVRMASSGATEIEGVGPGLFPTGPGLLWPGVFQPLLFYLP